MPKQSRGRHGLQGTSGGVICNLGDDGCLCGLDLDTVGSFSAAVGAQNDRIRGRDSDM